MTEKSLTLFYGEVLDEEGELTMAQLCRACEISAERVLELVEVGIVEPVGRDVARWRFRAVSIRRARRALRLQRDLGVNPAGAALAIDLLEELESARKRLQRFED